MTNRLLRFVTCVGLLMSAPVMSMAQPREADSQSTVLGTVEAIDHKLRTVTVRGIGGIVVTVDVPPDAVRFTEIKVGDSVTATFYNGVSIRLKPAGEPAVDQTLDPKTVATPGDLPGATRTRQRVTTVTITGWDPVEQGRELQWTDRGALHAPTAGQHQSQDRRGSQAGRPGGCHPDRGGDSRRAAGGPDRELAGPPHGLGPVRVGQPVQRQDDPGSLGPDGRRCAHQPGRDDLRRGLRPDWDLQGRCRLSDHSAH